LFWGVTSFFLCFSLSLFDSFLVFFVYSRAYEHYKHLRFGLFVCWGCVCCVCVCVFTHEVVMCLKQERLCFFCLFLCVCVFVLSSFSFFSNANDNNKQAEKERRFRD
jgi:hypothetical protein